MIYNNHHSFELHDAFQSKIEVGHQGNGTLAQNKGKLAKAIENIASEAFCSMDSMKDRIGQEMGHAFTQLQSSENKRGEEMVSTTDGLAPHTLNSEDNDEYADLLEAARAGSEETASSDSEMALPSLNGDGNDEYADLLEATRTGLEETASADFEMASPNLDNRNPNGIAKSPPVIGNAKEIKLSEKRAVISNHREIENDMEDFISSLEAKNKFLFVKTTGGNSVNILHCTKSDLDSIETILDEENYVARILEKFATQEKIDSLENSGYKVIIISSHHHNLLIAAISDFLVKNEKKSNVNTHSLIEKNKLESVKHVETMLSHSRKKVNNVNTIPKVNELDWLDEKFLERMHLLNVILEERRQESKDKIKEDKKINLKKEDESIAYKKTYNKQQDEKKLNQ